jgi:hypothetical protein
MEFDSLLLSACPSISSKCPPPSKLLLEAYRNYERNGILVQMPIFAGSA